MEFISFLKSIASIIGAYHPDLQIFTILNLHLVIFILKQGKKYYLFFCFYSFSG